MRKKYLLGVVLFALFATGCSSNPGVNNIINKSIAFYGMDKLDGKTIDFDFREKHFTVQLKGGNFVYQSSFTDSIGSIKDRLTNDGFTRERDGQAVKLSSKDSTKFSESLNSVIYFAFLPLKLKDKAVNAKFLRSVPINGKTYNQVEVTFGKQEGGSHFDDVFYYWFDAKDHSMDYFAYSKGGNRFRALNGLVSSGDLYLQNYINLEAPEDDKRDLKDYHVLFEQDKLIKLSEITLKNLEVK